MRHAEPGAAEALEELPTHLQQGLRLYIERGITLGSFLAACVENNLLAASTRAHDDATLLALPAIMRWLYTYAFSAAWGSPEKREAWQRERRAER